MPEEGPVAAEAMRAVCPMDRTRIDIKSSLITVSLPRRGYYSGGRGLFKWAFDLGRDLDSQLPD